MSKQKKRIERMGRFAFAVFAASLLTSCGDNWGSYEENSVSTLSSGGNALEIAAATAMSTATNEEEAQEVVTGTEGTQYTGRQLVGGILGCVGPVADLLDTDSCRLPAVKSRKRELAEGLEELFNDMELNDASFFPRMEGALQSGKPNQVKRALVEARDVLVGALTAVQRKQKVQDTDGFITGVKSGSPEPPVTDPDDNYYFQNWCHSDSAWSGCGTNTNGSTSSTSNTSNTSNTSMLDAPSTYMANTYQDQLQSTASTYVDANVAAVENLVVVEAIALVLIVALVIVLLIPCNDGPSGTEKLSGLQLDESVANIVETLGPTALPLKKG